MFFRLSPLDDKAAEFCLDFLLSTYKFDTWYSIKSKSINN
jgi:hypothetical protein